eukprot:CAMPEP_0171792532 /NCGR_PEP_ID=MMETSP0991-20121206/67033_1 /TAXON_ID=483369 /ORGANISM="non described non described, Strain CCMP2098" /LENGTH=41 /DNA_ID= /DNA_START= /DNA_END= /DNA_ORIENTATION=
MSPWSEEKQTNVTSNTLSRFDTGGRCCGPPSLLLPASLVPP